MSTSTPSFKWAEDSERIFLTIELQSATDVNVQLQPTRFTFSAKSGTPPTSYSLDFELPKSIEPSKSSWSVKGRQVEVVLVKAEDSEGWWHSLLKDKSQYKGRVKIDWDLWRDEDEEKALPDDFGGMGGGGMGGMGGGGGMPGMGGMGGAGGMDMAKLMAGMGGAGGMGGGMGGMNFGDMGGDMGGEEEDSDDEELPGLEDKDTSATETGEAGEGGKTGGDAAEKEDEDTEATKA